MSTAIFLDPEKLRTAVMLLLTRRCAAATRDSTSHRQEQGKSDTHERTRRNSDTKGANALRRKVVAAAETIGITAVAGGRQSIVVSLFRLSRRRRKQ